MLNPNMEPIIRSRINQNLVLTLVVGLLTVFNLACPGNGDGPGVDTTPPSIETVSPAEGSVDVSINECIRVIFSEQIDTNKITSPVVGFVLDPKGLMYNLTLEGSKISRISR